MQGGYEIRLQVLEADPKRFEGGIPLVVVAYTEHGVRQLRQVDAGPNGSDFLLPGAASLKCALSPSSYDRPCTRARQVSWVRARRCLLPGPTMPCATSATV